MIRNNWKSYLSKALTLIGLTFEEDYIEVAPYHYLDGVCLEPNHPVVVHHYRHYDDLVVNSADAEKITSVEAATEFIQSSVWGVGYMGSWNNTFFGPVSGKEGLSPEDVRKMKAMLFIWEEYNLMCVEGRRRNHFSCAGCSYEQMCNVWTGECWDSSFGYNQRWNLIKAVADYLKGTVGDREIIIKGAVGSCDMILLEPVTLAQTPEFAFHIPAKYYFQYVYTGEMPEFNEKIVVVTYLAGVGEGEDYRLSYQRSEIPVTDWVSEAFDFLEGFERFNSECKWSRKYTPPKAPDPEPEPEVASEQSEPEEGGFWNFDFETSTAEVEGTNKGAIINTEATLSFWAKLIGLFKKR